MNNFTENIESKNEFIRSKKSRKIHEKFSDKSTYSDDEALD